MLNIHTDILTGRLDNANEKQWALHNIIPSYSSFSRDERLWIVAFLFISCRLWPYYWTIIWRREEEKQSRCRFRSIRVPTCLKNSSIRALVQRECSAQGLDGWLMSAVWSNRDSALGLSILLEEAWCTCFVVVVVHLRHVWKADLTPASVTLICLSASLCGTF